MMPPALKRSILSAATQIIREVLLSEKIAATCGSYSIFSKTSRITITIVSLL